MSLPETAEEAPSQSGSRRYCKFAPENKGKQKVKIEFIEDVHKRALTFTKRRKGLFKKLAKLNELTGAEVVAIVMSPSARIWQLTTPGLMSLFPSGRSGNELTDLVADPETFLNTHEHYRSRFPELVQFFQDSKKDSTTPSPEEAPQEPQVSEPPLVANIPPTAPFMYPVAPAMAPPVSFPQQPVYVPMYQPYFVYPQ